MKMQTTLIRASSLVTVIVTEEEGEVVVDSKAVDEGDPEAVDIKHEMEAIELMRTAIRKTTTTKTADIEKITIIRTVVIKTITIKMVALKETDPLETVDQTTEVEMDHIVEEIDLEVDQIKDRALNM